MKARCILATLVTLTLLLGTANAQDFDNLPEQSQFPETSSVRYSEMQYQPLTVAQQRAHFEAEQRMYRSEWNNWIGYSPLRPTLNASYMSGISPRYYVPARGVIIHTGPARRWYW